MPSGQKQVPSSVTISEDSCHGSLMDGTCEAKFVIQHEMAESHSVLKSDGGRSASVAGEVVTECPAGRDVTQEVKQDVKARLERTKSRATPLTTQKNPSGKRLMCRFRERNGKFYTVQNLDALENIVFVMDYLMLSVLHFEHFRLVKPLLLHEGDKSE